MPRIKTRKKSTAKEVPASDVVEIPDNTKDKSTDQDEENQAVSSDEERKRKTRPPTSTQSVGVPAAMEIEVINPDKPESFLVYVKGDGYDIVAETRKKEVNFINELDAAIGKIEQLKLKSNCIRIHCSSASQQQKLLQITTLLG